MYKVQKKDKYNILVWGENIVECAILKKLSFSFKVDKVYTVEDFKKEYEFTNSYINDYKMTKNDIIRILEFAKNKKIDIFICDWSDNTQGIVDAFDSTGIRTIGVNQKWSKLEVYKHIGKNFMKLNGINTAPWTLIKNEKEFLNNINNYDYPVVVKANGPASGLGVYICKTYEEAINAFKKLKSGNTYPIQEEIIIEKFIEGIEFDIISLWDGKTLFPLLPLKDYKLRNNENKGFNTGSMGQYFPFEIDDKYQIHIKNYLSKLENALKKYNVNYKGAIYSALIVNEEDINCIEYNMRIGLTEGPLFMIHTENDIVDVFEALIFQELDKLEIKYKEGSAACVNIVTKNYPEKICEEAKVTTTAINSMKENDIEIFNTFGIIEENGYLKKNTSIFLMLAKSSKNPIKDIYDTLNNIDFDENFINCDYRSDIGS